MRRNLIIAGAFLALFSWIAPLPRVEAKQRPAVPAGDTVDLENAIIIKGIEMESDEPMAELDDTPGNGTIIYDNAFDDSLAAGGKRRGGDAGKKETVRKPRAAARIGIDELRRRDQRWHLTRYTIRKNDNLWQIAHSFDTDYRLIITVNRIDRPEMLQPGRSINVPNRRGVSHTVRRGDTVSSLARTYRMEAKRITAHNRLQADHIRIGETIFIPDGVKPVVESETRVVARAHQEVITRPEHKETAAREGKGGAGSKSAVALGTAKAGPADADEDETVDQGGREKPAGAASLRAIALAWPLQGKITSGFGIRRDPFSRKRKFHCGVDISVPEGTPVKATASGRVIFSGWKTGYGKVVIVRHTGGYITVYAHNSENKVEADDFVEKGDLVSVSGSSGAVTGPHLHFELRKYVNPLNPMRFMN